MLKCDKLLISVNFMIKNRAKEEHIIFNIACNKPY